MQTDNSGLESFYQSLNVMQEAVASCDEARIQSARQEAVIAARRLLSAEPPEAQTTPQAVTLEPDAEAQSLWESFEAKTRLAHLLGEAAFLSGVPHPPEIDSAQAASIQAVQQALSAGEDQPQERVEETRADTAMEPEDPRQAALEKYRQGVERFYASLLAASRKLIERAYGNLSSFDLTKILESLKELFLPGSLEVESRDELTLQSLQVLESAVEDLGQLHSLGLLGDLETEIKSLWEAIQEGEDTLQGFLVYSFASQQGTEQIAAWLQASNVEASQIEAGGESIQALTTQWERLAEKYSRLFFSLERLHALADWLAQRATLRIPLETILLGVYLVSLDVALLQGMDYADSAKLIDWVEGVMVRSRQVLGVENTTPDPDLA